MTEDEALEMFGFPPNPAQADDIRKALVQGTNRERARPGSGDSLFRRALCAQLFFFGHQSDTLLVWSAKRAGMDAGASIDPRLLFPTGLEATMHYLQDSLHPDGPEALRLIEARILAGNLAHFEVERYRQELRRYNAEEVGGHRLPERLVALWNEDPPTTELLDRLDEQRGGSTPTNFRILSANQMEVELNVWQDLVDRQPDHAAIYFLARGPVATLPTLDIDFALPIAMISADPFIWLEIKGRPEPRVVELGVAPCGTCGWFEIAPSLGAFLDGASPPQPGLERQETD